MAPCLLLLTRKINIVTLLCLLLVTIHLSVSFVVIQAASCARASTRFHASDAETSIIDGDNPSTLRSMTFCNLDASQKPQLLCDFLMEIGAQSTSIVDADRDTPLEQAIYREPEWSNPAVTCGDAAVGENVWNNCNVTAHFAASADLELVAELVSETLELPLVDYQVDNVENRDWIVHVQQSWKPLLISNLVLRFPWHSQQDVDELVGDNNNDDIVELLLQGGIAFGTGEHATTQLCLQWIQSLLKHQHDNFKTLLDYGCGSGVLGMAASALSKGRVTATGIDIDVDAVRIANINAQNNGLSMKSYLPPLETSQDDDESKSVLMKAHQVSQNEILPNENKNEMYDACVANILAMPLVTLAPTLASMVKPSGYLGLSGILEHQAEMVIEAYDEYFDKMRVEKELGGWILVTGRRKADRE